MDLELARAQALDARQAQAIAELERDRTLAVDQILELHTEAEDIRKALENWTHDGALTKAMRERLAEIRARIAHHDKLIEQKADQSTLDALARDMDERVAGTEETIDQVKRAAGETLEELREIRHFESRERVEN